MTRLICSLAFVCLLSACSDRTQLIVVIDSDLAIPVEVDEVRVTVVGPSGVMAEQTQALGDASDPDLPLTLGVRPAGDALGPIEIIAEGRRDGAVVVTREATTSLLRGEALVLHLFLSRHCRAVDCGAGETCTENGCASAQIDPEDLPPWTGQVPSRDGSAGDGGRDAGAMDGGAIDGGAIDGGGDAGPPVGCTTGSDCDDAIDCTEGICTEGVCTQRPDDANCTTAADGVCDPVDGCQYPECTPETCVALPCQTAVCVGDRCERTNLCGAGEACCAGACAPMGCDDGNPCTDDACGASGCEHADNAATCEDGVFCNGPDTCSGGSCEAHAGSPCSGSAVCDEAMDVCTGCLNDADCGAPLYGSWGTCGGFSGTCGESGTQTRSVTRYTCASGTCAGSTSTESRSCNRDTDGTSCGTTSCGSFGTCGGFSNTCDQTGTQSRTCTDYVCDSGACGTSTRTESTGCARSTDGASCGTTSCGAWGGCGGFSGACDETGTESRTCTDYECTSGSCGTSMRTENRDCSRSTDGDSCMTTSCSAWSTCSGFSTVCDTTGTQTRSCTDYECASQSCTAGTPRVESQSCARNTNGAPCDDGRSCTDPDQCSGGTCVGTDLCFGPCVCDPAFGVCIDPSEPSAICPF